MKNLLKLLPIEVEASIICIQNTCDMATYRTFARNSLVKNVSIATASAFEARAVSIHWINIGILKNQETCSCTLI